MYILYRFHIEVKLQLLNGGDTLSDLLGHRGKLRNSRDKIIRVLTRTDRSDHQRLPVLWQKTRDGAPHYSRDVSPLFRVAQSNVFPTLQNRW